MRTVRRIFTSVLVSVLLYFVVCLALVFWPVPQAKSVKNYDYSSLDHIEKSGSISEEHWLVLRDQTKMFYRYYPSKAPLTVVLIHGSGSESRYLANISSYLSGTGLARVVTPDLRGHGRTSKIKGDINYSGQLEDDIEDLIHDLRSKYPDQKIILGGHSSGAGLALRYEGNPDVAPADGYLLFAPYLAYNAPTVKPSSGNWVTVAVKRWVGLSMLNNAGIHAFDHLPVLFFNRPAEVNDSLQAQYYSYRLATSFQPSNYAGDIRAIHLPTLVVVGDQDESFYPNQFPIVFKDAKNTSVHIITGAKHLDLMNHPVARSWVAEWIQNFQSGIH